MRRHLGEGPQGRREREVYLYQVADNQECVALFGTQVVVAQTGFPGVIALELLATGRLGGYPGNPEAGVFPAQAFTADDFVRMQGSTASPAACSRWTPSTSSPRTAAPCSTSRR